MIIRRATVTGTTSPPTAGAYLPNGEQNGRTSYFSADTGYTLCIPDNQGLTRYWFVIDDPTNVSSVFSWGGSLDQSHRDPSGSYPQFAPTPFADTIVVAGLPSYFAILGDLNNRYGTDNVQLMADMNGSGDSTLITNRINDSLVNADAWVWGHLRSSLYSSKLPYILDRDGNIPRELVMCASMYAGYDLLRPRGFRDYDKEGRPMNHLYADFTEAEKMMQAIAAKTMFLMDVET
jgi:hypothetical protein